MDYFFALGLPFLSIKVTGLTFLDCASQSFVHRTKLCKNLRNFKFFVL